MKLSAAAPAATPAAFLCILMTAALPACSDDNSPAADSGTSTWLDGSLGTCASGCSDFVFSRIILPVDNNSTMKYSVGKDGKTYNSLGGILALISQVSKDVDLQINTDETICSGQGTHLMRIQASSLTSASDVKVQTWPAERKCCTQTSCLDATDKTKCSQTASQTCFSGSSSHTASATSGPLQVLGSITGGKLKAGPGKAVLAPLSFYSSPGKQSAAVFTLVGASITGTISKTGVTEGILNGGITQAEIQSKLIPTMASSFDTVYKDPKTDPNVKKLMKQFFDIDGDGSISSKEVSQNAALKGPLQGDIDLDGDGALEMSIGVGFQATGAKIQAP